MKTRLLRQNERIRVGDWVILKGFNSNSFLLENQCTSLGWVKLLKPNSNSVGCLVKDEDYIVRREIKACPKNNS